jgi:thiamine biosynthesis protein ThiS
MVKSFWAVGYDGRLMDTMTLVINGETRAVYSVSNVRELLERLEVAGSRVAVELNRKIIRRVDWESTPVANLDRIEIVQFVGGG